MVLQSNYFSRQDNQIDKQVVINPSKKSDITWWMAKLWNSILHMVFQKLHILYTGIKVSTLLNIIHCNIKTNWHFTSTLIIYMFLKIYDGLTQGSAIPGTHAKGGMQWPFFWHSGVSLET